MLRVHDRRYCKTLVTYDLVRKGDTIGIHKHLSYTQEKKRYGMQPWQERLEVRPRPQLLAGIDRLAVSRSLPGDLTQVLLRYMCKAEKIIENKNEEISWLRTQLELRQSNKI